MFLLKILLLIMCIGAITSIIQFVVDVRKWHDKEEDIKIVPSALDPEQGFTESEVKSYADNDGEHNTSTVSFPWSES